MRERPAPDAAAVPASPEAPRTAPHFDALAEEVLTSRVEANPVLASHLGKHDRDHEFPDLSSAREREELARTRSLRERLIPFLGNSGLDRERAVDAAILAARLDQEIWESENLHTLDWDPLAWTGVVSYGLDILVSRDFAPEAVRMESFLGRLRGLPELLAQARERLRPASLPHLEVALGQLQGFPGLLGHFRDHPDAPRGMGAAVEAAEEALGAYRDFLEGFRDQADPEGWRLGPERYRQALVHTLDSAESPEELLEAARAEILEAQTQLLRAARRFLGESPGEDPDGALDDSQRATIRRALEGLGERRATPETLVQSCREAVERCRELVQEADLLPPLPGDELRVELWPEHGRGVAVACLSAPGPFEGPEAQSSFYISPPPEDWSEEKTLSFLREYNLAQILVLAAHEAIPGHFAQLCFGRRHPSRVRSIFSSGTYCEGWAVYCERMMLEQGLGRGDPGVELATWKMRLRGAWNRVLDHWMHTGERSPEDCLRHLLEDGFQERGEAEGKLVRAKVTSCQLSTYFTGVHEVEAVVADWRRAHPGAPIRDLHQALLEHGSVPPRHLRSLMGLDEQG